MLGPAIMFDVTCLKHLAAIGIVFAACGGSGSGDDECRSTADCTGELECSGVNDGPVCGIAPLEQCSSDADCGPGNCHAVFDPCSFDHVGSECGEPCIDGMSCDEGFLCDQGHCIAQPCDAGFACAGREECDPGRIAGTAPVFDRHHGCFAVACTTDDECGERFCVNGSCQDDVGTCVVPVAVP